MSHSNLMYHIKAKAKIYSVPQRRHTVTGESSGIGTITAKSLPSRALTLLRPSEKARHEQRVKSRWLPILTVHLGGTSLSMLPTRRTAATVSDRSSRNPVASMLWHTWYALSRLSHSRAGSKQYSKLHPTPREENLGKVAELIVSLIEKWLHYRRELCYQR